MKPTPMAKAAAVRMFCAQVFSYEIAVAIYDALGSSDGDIDAILHEFGAARWDGLDRLDNEQWWEQLELLALDVDGAADHFAPMEAA